MDKKITYKLNRCKTVTIPNEEILELPKEALYDFVSSSFKEIELYDAIVDVILISKEMHPIFKSLGKDFFDETDIKAMNNIGIYGYLWTAKIKLVENIEHVIFIGRRKKDFEFKTEVKGM